MGSLINAEDHNHHKGQMYPGIELSLDLKLSLFFRVSCADVNWI